MYSFSHKRQSRERRLLWGLSLASIIVYINLYLMQGMLLAIGEHFNVSATKATLVLPVTSFTLAVALLCFAIVSDRIGRRTPILISLWLIVISNILLVFVNDFADLLVVRLFQGVALAALPAIAMAYFKEQLKPHFMLKAAAFYIAANSLGGISGRLIGGGLSHYFNWQDSMIVLSLLTLVGVIVVSWLLQIDQKNQQSHTNRMKNKVAPSLATDLQGFIHHIKDKQMCLVYTIGGIAFMMMVNQFSFVQLHLIEHYQWDRFSATLIFLCYLSGTFASYCSAGWIAKYGQNFLYRKAITLMFCGTILTLNDTAFFIFAGFMLTASGFFLMHACCNSWVAIRATEHKAKATSLYLCSYYLGASIGGPYLLWFWQQDGWPGVVAGSMLLLALLSLALLLQQGLSEQETAEEELSDIRSVLKKEDKLAQ